MKVSHFISHTIMGFMGAFKLYPVASTSNFPYFSLHRNHTTQSGYNIFYFAPISFYALNILAI